jgi:hypothetical protein
MDILQTMALKGKAIVMAAMEEVLEAMAVMEEEKEAIIVIEAREVEKENHFIQEALEEVLAAMAENQEAHLILEVEEDLAKADLLEAEMILVSEALEDNFIQIL